MPTRIFVSSRKRMAMLLFVSLAFVALALFLPPDGQPDDWRVYGEGFFGLCAIVFVCLLVRPQTLTVDGEGFILSGGLTLPSRIKKIPWRDVQEFFVYQTGRGNKLIGINFKPGASEHTGYARFSQKAFGADGGLPGYWSDGCESVVQELNEYRERALRDQRQVRQLE